MDVSTTGHPYKKSRKLYCKLGRLTIGFLSDVVRDRQNLCALTNQLLCYFPRSLAACTMKSVS
jgi:hypothetical protein